MKDKHIAVWFSCGTSSAVVAKLTNANCIGMMTNLDEHGQPDF
jgi:hypothetical protein